MNKILIVIEREFSTRIRKKSFILLTILMPFLVIGVICLPILLAGLDSNKEIKLTIQANMPPYSKTTGICVLFHSHRWMTL